MQSKVSFNLSGICSIVHQQLM